ncbi:MAG: diaminopimelate epimerase [Candidatus Promineifilaceae bacterium]
MTPQKEIGRFAKYHALGNDMLVLDPLDCPFELTAAAARLLCDRHAGLGADGLCYGPLNGGREPFEMRFFNPDGSQAEKSGNGLRIFGRYIWERGYAPGRRFNLAMNQETLPAWVEEPAAGRLGLLLGRLSFDAAEIPLAGRTGEFVEQPLPAGAEEVRATAVSAGNPHCVVFVPETSAELARRLGPLLEAQPLFPKRTNVQFVQILDPHAIRVEIWERGAGYTLASGTSAAAAAGAAVKTGRCASPVQVHMPGGALEVALDAAGQVSLSGAVSAVASGRLAAEFLGRLLETGRPEFGDQGM